MGKQSEKKRLFPRITARFRKSPFYSYFLEKTGRKLENKNWIFILGCYNSGTTLLNQLLAEHPSISGLPDEGVMLTDQLVKPEDYGWRRMWWKCVDQMESDRISRNRDSSRIKRHWSHFYEDKKFLVEKSISNVCRISFFSRHFQPAYFIHIVRNGYAVAEGIRRKAEIMPGNEHFEHRQYPIDLCIRQWTETLDVISKEKPHMERFLEISYEELAENTAITMKRITDFLNLEPYEESFFQKSFSVHEKSSEIMNMNSGSFQKLSPEDIKTINAVATDHLIKKGYSLL